MEFRILSMIFKMYFTDFYQDLFLHECNLLPAIFVKALCDLRFAL